MFSNDQSILTEFSVFVNPETWGKRMVFLVFFKDFDDPIHGLI